MYEQFADVYDRLMDDFDYAGWARYYLEMLARQGVTPDAVCECGCGTGSLSAALAGEGIRVTGVDLSESMLRVAAEKARRAGVMIPFVRQDMCALTLPRPVDAVLCPCDGVNYLLEEARVRAFFDRARSSLKAGGALAFDVSSREKLARMADAPYFEDREDITYFWRNRLEGRLIRMELTFFVRQGGGLYRRFDEDQLQRLHSREELALWLTEAGFSQVRVYGDRTFFAPGPEETRWHFVATKA